MKVCYIALNLDYLFMCLFLHDKVKKNSYVEGLSVKLSIA